MFVDSFTLKKTAWHCRLMKYIWGLNHTDFSHICPYFWLSVFNVIISPVLLPIKFFFKTAFPYVWKYLKVVLKWGYKYIEKWLAKMGDYLDRQAVAAQARWEARREAEIAALDLHSMPIKKFFELPTQVLEDFKRGQTDWAADKIIGPSWSTKAERKTRQWFRAFKKLHETKPDFWDSFLKKREEYLETLKQESLQQETERNLREVAFRQIKEREREKRQQKLMYAASRQELEDMKAHARKLAQEEKRRAMEPDRLAREARLAAIKAANKRRIIQLLKFCKPIATGFIWLVGGIVALVGIYFVYQGVKWVGSLFVAIPHSAWVTTAVALKWTGLSALAILTLVGVIIGLKLLIPRLPKPKVKVKAPDMPIGEMLALIPWPKLGLKRKLFNPIGRIFRSIWRLVAKGAPYLVYTLYPFVLLWKGFISFFKGAKLFFRILGQTIKNNCPSIDWRE